MQGVPTAYLPIKLPLSIFPLTPYLHFPLEPRARCALRVFGSDEVVDTKGMYAFERLYEREVGGCGTVDLNRGGAAGGEEGCWCGCEGEDVGGVGICKRVQGEVLFRLHSLSHVSSQKELQDSP
jgi:hypothetical protein